jgi:hypothetical protein
MPEASSLDPLLNTFMTAACNEEVSRRMRALFKHLDINGSGSLSYHNLSEGLKVPLGGLGFRVWGSGAAASLGFRV